MNADASLCLLDEPLFGFVHHNGQMQLSCMRVCVCRFFLVNSYFTVSHYFSSHCGIPLVTTAWNQHSENLGTRQLSTEPEHSAIHLCGTFWFLWGSFQDASFALYKQSLVTKLLRLIIYLLSMCPQRNFQIYFKPSFSEKNTEFSLEGLILQKCWTFFFFLTVSK